ncbi:MAG: response regulator [Acidobacteria bacterium]|nr:response regulator [Acidobacteriota bacterium]
MGGVISVDTREGEGSTFWFTLPFQRLSNATISARARRQGFAGIRALILDRSQTSQKILRHHLTSWEIELTFVNEADEALAALRKAASEENPYRLMIFDHRLPDRKGIELAREISSDDSLENARLVMMAPVGVEMNDTVLRDSGIDAVISKPIEQVELFEKTSGLFAADILAETMADEQIAAPAPIELPLVDRIPPDLQILLAEDKPLNQKLTLSQLKQLGLSADIAVDGSQAVETVRNKKYDVILMDCQMPIMDGYEATMRIRENEPEDRKIYIIALTAHAMEGERERCIAAGMNDYLSKPTRQHELAAALKKALVSR